jgi:hypothetical protein
MRRFQAVPFLAKLLWATGGAGIALASSVPADANTTLATVFRTPQRHVDERSMHGVLTEYERDGGTGGFNLRDNSTGTVDRFEVARGIRIDGKSVVCSDPPQPGYDHFEPGPACPDWPRAVVIGRTHVIVRYRSTVDQEGHPVNVSDEIVRER